MSRDKKENWITERIIAASAIIRRSMSSTEMLNEDMLQFIVKQTSSVRGRMFLLDKNELAENFFKKASVTGKNVVISNSDSLLGDCLFEKKAKVEKNGGFFVAGFPLILRNEAIGVIELVSVREFESYEIEFVMRLGESLAVAITTAKVREHTRVLLEKTRRRTEELMAQEDKIRLNQKKLNSLEQKLGDGEGSYLQKIWQLDERLGMEMRVSLN